MIDTDWLKLLLDKLRNTRENLTQLDDYYRGEQPLSFMNAQMLAEFGERVRPLVLGWPALVVDSAEERLDVEGFRQSDSADADERLWEIWQANNLDEGSQMGQLDAMVAGRSFAMVGTNPDGKDLPPLITVESALQVAASWDPQTRKVRAAVKSWTDPETKQVRASLYLPTVTVQYELAKRGRSNWAEISRDEHDLEQPPVVPLVNRPRTLRPEGESEISATIRAITDAANKTGTDMMTSVEFHAMPRRWVFGATASDFEDERGRPVNEWSSIAGRIWALSNPEAKAGQFAEAALDNFHGTIRILAEQLAALGCLPPHYVGLTTANPASADAIRSAEARLVKRVERKQRAFGGAWENVMRLAVKFQTGKDESALSALETIWADASTPTVAQRADAAVKLHAAGIVPLHQTREDLGYTATQIERMVEQDVLEQAAKDASMAGMLGIPTDVNVDPGPPEPVAD